MNMQNIIEITKSLSFSFIIIILGYIAGKIIKVVSKFFLSKIIGIDKWLEMKNIKIFYGNFSEIFSNLLKDFTYLIFFSYSLIFSRIEILMWLGNLTLNIFGNLLILILVLIVVHLIVKVFLEDLLMKIKIFAEIEWLKTPILFILYLITVIVTLDYLGYLSKALLYIFLVSFSGIVIFLSIIFGIAYGEKIKEKIKNK